jgi:hypothetical protein
MTRKSARPSPAKGAGLALILPALGALILAFFWPTLHSQFSYDSQAEILNWDWLHDPHNLLTAVSFRIMGLDVVDFNRPVAVAWLMFVSLFSGRDPFGYYLASILLHIAVACLAFLLLRHLLGLARPQGDPARHDAPAFLATLIFALHPVVTEAVCEPANCKDGLALLFGLAAILLAVRHRPGPPGPGDAARMLLCPFLCLLSIGSKELGLAFPVLLFVYWLLFRRDESRRYWLVVILAGTLVDVAFLIARFTLEHHPSEVFLHAPTYPAGALAPTFFLVQPRIFALYLVNLLCPLWLCADYNGYSIGFYPLWLAWPLVLLVAAALIWIARKDRRACFSVAFIVLTLLPVSNLVPIFRAAADRFLYAPLIGLALLAALALDSAWLARHHPWRHAAVAAVIVLLALSFPITLQREQAWSSAVSLWQDTLARNPTSFPAWVNLPDAYLEAGRLEEAKTQSEKALQTPYKIWPWVWFDYAIELEKLGDHAGAERAARRAIELKPDITDTPKMVRTLQESAGLMHDFEQITARLPANR